jgi:hypothetical protein
LLDFSEISEESESFFNITVINPAHGISNCKELGGIDGCIIG